MSAKQAQPIDSLVAVPSSKRPNLGLGLTVPVEFVDALADAVAGRLESAPAPAAEMQADRSRLALSIAEAADSLGMSADHFRRHVLPDLRVVRTGRLRLIPLAEVDGWLEGNAARALEPVA